MTPDAAPGVAGILRRHGLRPRRSLGQNFLEDPSALREIVEAAALTHEDVVLEIGAGVGGLTRILAHVARRVVGVEVDPALASICREELRAHSNIEIVNADVLSIAPRTLGLEPGYVVAANIPYYITSPILRHLFESEPRPRRIVLTVQREVAARICAKPPEMSLLAISVQVHGATQMLGTIPAGAFYPKPKVDSAIIRIDCFERPRVEPDRLEGFFRIVRAGFLQPRKMLRNSMASGMKLAAHDLEPLLRSAGIDSRRRAETLAIEEWIRIADSVNSTTG